MEGLEHLLPLDNGLLKSLTGPLLLSMKDNDIALAAALTRIDFKAWVEVGKEVTQPALRSFCDQVTKELVIGSTAYVIAGVITVAILYGAYCAGKKFGTLQRNWKGVVVVSSTSIGAVAGAGVVKLAALGAGVVAGAPAMLAGAAVGVLAVWAAGAFGNLVGERDRQTESHQEELAASQNDFQNRMSAAVNDFQNRMRASEKAHQEDMKKLQKAHQKDMDKLQKAHQKDMDKLQEENKALKEELTKVKTELTEIKTMLKEERMEKEALKEQLSAIKTMMQQILANQQQNGNTQ